MLQLLGKIYGSIADLRNRLYDRDLFKSYSLGARTISIGNITTGGTGKTPLVAYVAEILANAGEKVCILTRGYGRTGSGRILVSDATHVLVDAVTGGDEPVELAQRLNGKAIVISDADRLSAATWAKEKYGVTAFVLDDGFQHRRAKRDLDIVCLDATDPDGGGFVLPAGKLREFFVNLGRADAIVITRADLVESIDPLKERLRRRNFRAAVFVGRTEIVRLTPLTEFGTRHEEEESGPNWTRLLDGNRNELRALAFCGLGNPDAFFSQLRTTFDQASINGEFQLTAMKKFPDHNRYTQTDVAMVEATAGMAGASTLLTTAKDAVKLRDLKFDLPCYVVEIEFRLDNPEAFRDLVLSV